MTIAVSGSEGNVCPSSQGLSALVYKKHFPQNIALAVTAITTSTASPALSSLSRAAKGVLAFIVRLAECTEPTKPSWAFKKTIAKEIGTSESTVYRGLNELTKEGLIKRLGQERKSHNGRLFVSRLQLTKKACACLGLSNTRCKRRYSPDSSRKQDPKREIHKTSPQVSHQQVKVTVLEGPQTEATLEITPHQVSSSLAPTSKILASTDHPVIDALAETAPTAFKPEEDISKDSSLTTPIQEVPTASISYRPCSTSVESKRETAIEMARTESSAYRQEEEAEQGLGPLTPLKETLTVPLSHAAHTASAAPQNQVIHRPPSVNLKDGQYNTLPLADQRQSIKKQPGQPGTFSVKIANRRIPSDLAWLVQDNCLSVTGLLHLMGTAKKMGHLLSDIVKLRQSAIRPHTGRELYAYLRALITKPVDYGYLRAQQDKEQAMREQEAVGKARREALIKEGMEKLRGRTFLSEEGIHYTFEEANYISTKQLRNGTWYTGGLHAHHACGLIEHILAGKLREVSEKAQLDCPNAECRNPRAPNSGFTAHLGKLRALLQMSVSQPVVV